MGPSEITAIDPWTSWDSPRNPPVESTRFQAAIHWLVGSGKKGANKKKERGLTPGMLKQIQGMVCCFFWIPVGVFCSLNAHFAVWIVYTFFKLKQRLSDPQVIHSLHLELFFLRSLDVTMKVFPPRRRQDQRFAISVFFPNFMWCWVYLLHHVNICNRTRFDLQHFLYFCIFWHVWLDSWDQDVNLAVIQWHDLRWTTLHLKVLRTCAQVVFFTLGWLGGVWKCSEVI